MTDVKQQTKASGHAVAEMFFDPMCPFAWMTSRWLMQVEQVRDIEVQWNSMSLAVLNDGRDLPERYQLLMANAWLPARLVMAARLQHGDAVAKPLYDAIGTRLHPGGADGFDIDVVRKVLAESLAECDLPADLLPLAERNDGDEVDVALRASHKRAIDMVGDDVGTPVVAFGDVAFFGPVVSPAPKGEAAGRLWDGCLLVAGTPGFYELKRTRDTDPDFS